MPERIIHLPGNCTNRDLREAAADLIFTTNQITQHCIEKLIQITPSASVYDLRLALNHHHLSEKARENWKKREGWVIRLFLAAKIINHPEQVFLRTTEFLQTIDQPLIWSDILTFFINNQSRLDYLLSRFASPTQLDSLRFASYSLIENYILKSAITTGKLFVNPRQISLSFKNPHLRQ